MTAPIAAVAVAAPGIKGTWTMIWSAAFAIVTLVPRVTVIADDIIGMGTDLSGAGRLMTKGIRDEAETDSLDKTDLLDAKREEVLARVAARKAARANS
jgi:hypothetical protein